MITHKIVCGQSRALWLDDDDTEDVIVDDSVIEDDYEGVSDPNDYDHIQDSFMEDPGEH